MSTAERTIALIALGGTIASVKGAGEGVSPQLDAADLLGGMGAAIQSAVIEGAATQGAAIEGASTRGAAGHGVSSHDGHTHDGPTGGDISGRFRIRPVTFRRVPSPALTLTDIAELAAVIDREVAAGAAGIVVTQGTDTLEECAFALDLMTDHRVPIVMTGAMRNPTVPGADGPANLLAAIQTAGSGDLAGCGVVVVMNDEIHAARHVQKRHTTNCASFGSPGTGALGAVVEGRVWLAMTPATSTPTLPRPTIQPPVALLRLGLGDDSRLLGSLIGLGFQGCVVEAFGGGHVPPGMAPDLQRVAESIPTILTSRVAAGVVLRETYGYPGSERDLLARGLIWGGSLGGLKSRILLATLLAAGSDAEAIATAFQDLGC